MNTTQEQKLNKTANNHMRLMLKVTGHNSRSKWGLPVPNQGITKKQQAQQVNDKQAHKRALETSYIQGPSPCIIPYAKRSITKYASGKGCRDVTRPDIDGNVTHTRLANGVVMKLRSN